MKERSKEKSKENSKDIIKEKITIILNSRKNERNEK